MPSYTNLSCITDLIDVVNSCTADQSDIEYFLDDLGISLSTTAKAADERYVTGQNLVDNKIRIALDEVYSHLTKNVTSECDLDKTDGILCDNASKIARAVWYQVAALIWKEVSIDSKRYNDVIHYSGGEALAQMVYYDSSLAVFTSLTEVPAGMYQKELNKLEPIRRQIEQSCVVDCTGSSWQITIP